MSDKEYLKYAASVIIGTRHSPLYKEKVAKKLLQLIKQNETDAFRYVTLIPDSLVSVEEKFNILNKGIELRNIDCSFEKVNLKFEKKSITENDFISKCELLAKQGQKDAMSIVAERLIIPHFKNEPMPMKEKFSVVKMLCDSYDAVFQYQQSLNTLIELYSSFENPEDENVRHWIDDFACPELKRILHTLVTIDDYCTESNEYLLSLLEDYPLIIPLTDYYQKILDYLLNVRHYNKAYDFYVIGLNGVNDLSEDFIYDGIRCGSVECDAISEWRMGYDCPETCIEQLISLSRKGSVYASEQLVYIYLMKEFFVIDKAYEYAKVTLNYGLNNYTGHIQDTLYHEIYETYHYNKVIEEKEELFTKEELKEYESVITVN